MDAAPIIAGWKRRLVALADRPEYVFRDTPHHLIEQHDRRLTTFAGYTETEVAAAEARLDVRFPGVFREYLREMAKSPGDLFRGSDLAGVHELEQFRAEALELLAETDPALTLPPRAVVFLLHQGYTFVYLLAAGGFDGPLMQWTETEREPRQVAAGFADMVDAELRLMESNNAELRNRGGSYLTFHPEGGSTQSHPALASGERPLDQAPTGKPWWQFW
ncbi:MAG TPA: SMI1/KNR4 family protein [Thermoanaerobaculia bacterium]|nr:SMI1/KNR4 family protein [Thermoanaerobaculia bacterium]